MQASDQTVSRGISLEGWELVSGLPVGVLHLGIKTEMLKAAGYNTIGDIRNADPDVIARAPSVGWRTVEKLVRNRLALANSCRLAASVDWARYCEAIGVPLAPAAESLVTGEEFLKALPVFFEEVAAHLSDELLAIILRERICQPPGRQTTLDEIAGRTSPALSRERIRQKEKKLLGQLTGGLLNDSYNGLDIHFRPSFSYWWRIAADALAGIDDIEAKTFISLLCEVWNVPHASVMGNLPVILAIVTGEPQMSGGFRSASRINPKFFNALDEKLKLLSVRRIRFGRCASQLEDSGLPALGSVVTELQSDGLARVGKATAKKVAIHLELLAGCISNDGTVDWAAYRDATGLKRLPASAPVSTTEFVGSLCPSVEMLLRLHPMTKRAAEIFVRRTSRDATNRMTLQRVADELHTHLPTVKREETVMLSWLYDVLIDRDFSSLHVWLDESWLRFWSEASDVYDAAADYQGFTDNLAWRWRLSGTAVRQAAPLLWAVLDGYPDGRRSGYIPPCVPSASPAFLGRIHLKGFRRLH